MKHFEKEIPEGYKLALTVDAKKDKKLIILMNLAALLIGAAVVAPSYIILFPKVIKTGFPPLYSFTLMIGMLVYIVLHEITHGIVYKAFTKQKLTFGMTLTVAYCGVPDIYVYRKAALAALLAPFLVFTVVFGALWIALPTAEAKIIAAALMAIHLGGCAGDLYCTMLYLFKFKSNDTLMNDTGPTQTFYVKE